MLCRYSACDVICPTFGHGSWSAQHMASPHWLHRKHMFGRNRRGVPNFMDMMYIMHYGFGGQLQNPFSFPCNSNTAETGRIIEAK